MRPQLRNADAFGLCLVVLGLSCALAAPTPPPLRVGTSGDYPPFSAGSEEGGGQGASPRFRGFDVEIAEAFAEDTGRVLVWVPFRWPQLLGSLEANRFDVAMSGVTVRPERSVEGRFSLPVARTGAVLLVREDVRQRLGAGVPAGDDRALLEALDVPALRIAVNAGGHLERVTRRHFRAARVRAIPDNHAVPRALERGEVDAVVTDTLEAPRWLAAVPGSVPVGPFTQDWKAYWLQAGDEALARELDDWLLAREADGQLRSWRSAWFGDASPAQTAAPRAALLAACDERLALMPFVAGFKREHGRAVVDAAREERVLAAAEGAVQAAAQRLGLSAPPSGPVKAFYRAQIDAAVELQQRVLAAPREPRLARFDLERELRPALIRIGDRMASLLVWAAHDSWVGNDFDREADTGAALPLVEAVLARHSLSQERLGAIALSLEAVESSQPRVCCRDDE